LDITSNFDIVGDTICSTYQTGTWTYTFEGIGSENGDDVNISGTMTATDQFGSSFDTPLDGFVTNNNNGIYMYLEWEFPEYSIVGYAELQLQ
jgi:hypothetical protein